MELYLLLAGGAIAFLHALIIMYWRGWKLNEIEAAQKKKGEEVWRTNYLERYRVSVRGKIPYDIAKLRESFDKYTRDAIENLQSDYSKQILLAPYTVLVILWVAVAYGMAQVSIATQTNLLGLLLTMSLFPLLLQGFLDLVLLCGSE